ncbi:MAG: DUF4440 domain-containing protein [Terriglobales bacterium]
MRKTAAVLAMAMMLTAAATAQAGLPFSNGQKAMPATRVLLLFTGLERELLVALQQDDRQTQERLLSGDFRVWSPDAGQYPLSRQRWLASTTGPAHGAASIRRLAVRELGRFNVVSFSLSRGTGEEFIVDLWHNVNGWWKLTDRYVSKLGK